MKSYPSIIKKLIDSPGIAFDKLDGSNIRAEWSKEKKGFFKFGSRTKLIDESHPILGESINLFKEKYSEPLSKKLFDKRFKKGVAFFEFFGENSFAGDHKIEKKDVVLFDLCGDKGLLYPKDYLNFVEGLDIAKVLYEGYLTKDFIEKVESGSLEGMTFEGVIFKSHLGRPGLPDMTKIKNKAWIEKLKVYCKDDEDLFKKLL